MRGGSGKHSAISSQPSGQSGKLFHQGGCGRSGDAELAPFFQIALGSASELEYHLLLACNLHFLSGGDHEKLASAVTEVKRMLTSFIKKLSANR